MGADQGGSSVQDYLWERADQLVDHQRPGDFNQAMMELGATICTPRNPQCAKCPLSHMCQAFKESKMRHTNIIKTEDNSEIKTENVPELRDIENCHLCLTTEEYDPDLGVTNYPRKAKKTASKNETNLVAVISKNVDPAKYAMLKRPKTGLLANLLEFPSLKLETGTEENLKDLSEFLSSLGLSVSGLKNVGEVSHIFSHINMRYVVYSGSLVEDEPQSDERIIWLSKDEFLKSGTSTAMKKVFKCKEAEGDSKKAKGVKRKREESKSQKSIQSYFTR